MSDYNLLNWFRTNSDQEFLQDQSTAQKIIEAEQIPAEVGKNITLPCKVPNNYKIENIAVEWIRPDQDPDHVLFYRDGLLHPYNQHPSYQNRVDLKDKEMKDGNFSLILKNVTKNDTGRYECRVFEKEKNELINIIILVVHLPGEKFEGDQDGNTGDGGDKTVIIVGSVVGVILLLLAVLGSVGFLIYRRLMRQNPNHPVPPDDPAAIEMAAVPESPVEPPTASEALMEAPAEEQSENVK